MFLCPVNMKWIKTLPCRPCPRLAALRRRTLRPRRRNNATLAKLVQIPVSYLNSRRVMIPISFRLLPVLVGAFWFVGAEVSGQVLLFNPAAAARASETNSTLAALPESAADLDAAIASVDQRLDEVRALVSAWKTTPSGATNSVLLSADELSERNQIGQQWSAALDQHARSLRSLKKLRGRQEERSLQEENWHGFPQPPNIAVAEQLTDSVSAQRLDLRSAEMLLAILNGEASRFATQLNESRKQLRLLEDDPGQTHDLRQQALLQLARLRTKANEASVEAAQIARLVTWEAMDGQRRYLHFLERKSTIARAHARMTKVDLDEMLAQINQRRLALKKDFDEASAAEKELRAVQEAAAGRLRQLTEAHSVEGQLALEVANAQLETCERKIESLRGFLRLADLAQSVWEDRLWITQGRTLRELRAKRRQAEESLKQLGEWKALMEQTLSAASEQVLREALRFESARLTAAERGAAQQIHAALQERAWIGLRTVGALVFVEDLTLRLRDETTEQIAQISLTGRVSSLVQDIRALVGRVWQAELYIAEDSVIAGGKKISIPRSITLGKVVIATTIVLAGLVAARGVFRLINRWTARWFQQKQRPSDVPAKLCAAGVAFASLFIAMVSVRIPWTLFAFMGGALAIGVGFGAQTLINNFISGLILLCERSIRVGDIVEVDDQRGKIVHVGFRNSLVSRGDGIEVLVPNSRFLEKRVVNWTLSDDLVRYVVTVNVHYGSPLDKVSELITQAAVEHPHVVKKPAPNVLLDDFGDNALVFSLHFWMRLCPGADGGMVRSELRHRIHALLDQAGVSIASPQRAIQLESSRRLEIKVVDEGSFHPREPSLCLSTRAGRPNKLRARDAIR